MKTHREAMQQAIEALEAMGESYHRHQCPDRIPLEGCAFPICLKARLAVIELRVAKGRDCHAADDIDACQQLVKEGARE